MRLKPGQHKEFSISSDKPKNVAVQAPKDCNEDNLPDLTCKMAVHWEGSVFIERPKPKKKRSR